MDDMSVDDVAGQLETNSLKVTPEHVFLDQIVFNNIIQETLFLHLTPLEFLRFARTCRLVHSIVNSYIKRSFNINRFLTRFFSDPVAFRSLQARTGTLISGSSALQFFDRTFYPESDLDLYVPKQSDRKVISWLTLNGYKFVPGTGQPLDLEEAIIQSHPDAGADAPQMAYDSGNMQAVFTFSKPSIRAHDADLKVQCIISKIAPLELILKFHSTCVINVISFDKAYALYPRATLHEHRSLVCVMQPAPSQPAALQKYADRGFTIVTNITGLVDPAFHVGVRYMGDSMCWTLPLDMQNLEPNWQVSMPPSTPLSQDPACAASWELIANRSYVKVNFRVWRSPHLYWNYPAVAHHVVNYARRKILAEVGVNIGRTEIAPVYVGRYFDDEFIKHCVDYYRQYAAGEVSLT